jgi:PRC-barrel domain protein
MSTGEDAERFRIGAEVEGTDGTCGELTGVIIDPVARALTHLIVKPRHHHGFGRLVPIDLVDADGDRVRLSCTVSQFLGLDEGEETQLLTVADATSGYARGQAYQPTGFDLGPAGGRTESGMGAPGFGHHAAREEIASDRVPAGEVEVKRGDPVHASDGFIGSVEGLIVDPAGHHVTHVLLAEGHFWGRKQVAIPIGAMTRRDQEIRVDLTKEQIEALPPVDPKSVP